MAYENILSETRGPVGLITLNRPQAMNALNAALMSELASALDAFETDDSVGAMVITGNEKAFAAGADIKEMKDKSFMEAYLEDFLTGGWERAASCRKPVIAAVADFILAADNAKFGQPEITIGAIPGLGGTQRLTRAIGKSKAMEMCLTGRMIDAEEAERAGLVSRIVPVGELVDEAVKTAAKAAAMSRPLVLIAKEAVDRAFETTLVEGLRYERRMFHAIFATEDQKEGMAAFAEKRKPTFSNR